MTPPPGRRAHGEGPNKIEKEIQGAHEEAGKIFGAFQPARLRQEPVPGAPELKVKQRANHSGGSGGGGEAVARKKTSSRFNSPACPANCLTTSSRVPSTSFR